MSIFFSAFCRVLWTMQQPLVQIDPLDSPHPIPWTWMLANLNNGQAFSGMRYYRSPSLLSPDRNYAAYTRIQLQLEPEFYRSRVSSVLFLENLQTGDFQMISAQSPLAETPLRSMAQVDAQGVVAVLIPVAWSESGDRLLAREFESILGSDIASDYGVVWDRLLNRHFTIAPTCVAYTNAVLLGWSQQHPDRVLFRAGMLGEQHWDLLAVDQQGDTLAVPDDTPLTFGALFTDVWAGPQAYLHS